MGRLWRIVAVAVMVLNMLCYQAGAAPKQGTKAEAKAMVEKAVAYSKKFGKEKALAEFNNPKGQFRDRDLYIFAYDMKGINLAHQNSKWVGHDFLDLDDADGKPLIRNLIAVAKGGGGWYDYKWSNPFSKKNQNKSSYILLVDGTYFVGCGVYTK